MRELFTYMFKDNKFVTKASMYFLFVLSGTFCLNYASALAKTGAAPASLLLLILGAILMFIPYGYVMSCVKALTEQRENYVLPRFNIKSNFVIGFKYSVSIFIVSLVFGTVTVIAAFIIGLIAGILKAKVLAAVLFTSVIVISMLLFIFYTLALNWIFANTHAITSFLQFKKAHALIKQDYPRYWKGLGLMLLINFVIAVAAGFVLSIAGTNIIAVFIATLIAALVSSYVVFVNTMINAKSITPECKI